MSARGTPERRTRLVRGPSLAASPVGPRRAEGERTMSRGFGLAALACALTFLVPEARAEETIKVGILHSLSGTMAISETTLKDVALMTIDDLNARGGLLGRSEEHTSELQSPVHLVCRL